MASLWNALREEVLGTVDEFRQKGAIGALRDAALDTRDMATDAGSWLWGGVKELVAGDGQQPQSEAVLRSNTVPQRGATAPLELPDGSLVEALVVDIDGVSEPPRARVTYEGSNEPLLVLVLAEGVLKPTPSREAGLLGNLKEEWNATVQDFREKGAVGAVRDAALDAVDIVGSTAKTAVSGARSLASPLIDLDWDQSKAAPGAAAAGAVESAAPAGEARGAATTFAPPPRAGGLLEGLKQEIRETVQDFREKGAVGAVKDAALDAVDLVGSTAVAVASGAASLARPVLEKAPLLPDLWASPEPAAGSGASGVPAAAASEPIPAASSRAGPSATAAPKDKASPTAGLLVTGPSPAAPPAAAAAALEAESMPATAAAAATSPGSGGGSTSPTAATSPRGPAPGTPPNEATSSDMPGAKPPRKSGSLVSMRRNQFEKPKEEPKKEDKEAEEELLD